MAFVEKFSVSLYPLVVKEIEKRGSQRSPVIGRDLMRLYALYERALARMKLTEAEACLLVDILNGSLFDAVTAKFLWSEVQEAIQLEGADKKWKVDGAALVEKLRALNEIECLAIVDAAERFWEKAKEQDDLDIRENVKEFFLIR